MSVVREDSGVNPLTEAKQEKSNKPSSSNGKEVYSLFGGDDFSGEIQYIPGEIPNFIDELSANFSSYLVDKKASGIDWVDITSFPPNLKLTLNKLKTKVRMKRNPGIHPMMCCCILHGLNILEQNKFFIRMGELVDYFNKLKQLGTPQEEFLSQYLTCKIYINLDRGPRQNIAVTEEVKNKITTLSSNTGIQESTLAVIASYAYLINQNEVPKNYIQKWSDTVESAYGTIEMKVSGAEAMIRVLEKLEVN